MRLVLLLCAGGLALAGCGPKQAAPARAAPPVAVPVAVPARPVAPPAPFSVHGQSAPALLARFGAPQIDLKEGRGRKLQFLGPICVLDAYLYPAEGRGEAVVRHVDARQRSGGPIDEASCVVALTRRAGP